MGVINMPKVAVTEGLEPRRRGRPPRKNVASPPDFDYEQGKQTIQRDSEFWRFCEGYPDKSGLSVYVYRLWPAIDFNLIGRRDAYITIVTDPAKFHSAGIIEEFGGGEYWLKASDANARPPDRAKSWIRCLEPDVVPKLDLRTLKVNDPRNADYIEGLIATGAMVRDTDGRARLRTGDDTLAPGGAPVGPGSAVPVAVPAAAAAAPPGLPVSVIEKLTSVVLERLLATPPASDPESVFNLAWRIADRVTPPAAQAAPPPAPVSALQQLESLVALKSAVGDLFGPPAVAAPPGAGWWSIIPQVLPMLPSLLQSFAALASTTARGAGAPAGPPSLLNTGVRPGAGIPYADVSGGGHGSGVGPVILQGVPVEAAAPVPPGVAGGEPFPAVMDLPPELQGVVTPEVMEKLLRLAPVALSKWDSGECSGLDFAVAFHVLEGKPLYRLLYAVVGAENVFRLLSVCPHPSLLGATEAKLHSLREWVDEFLSLDVDAAAAA